MQIKIMHRLLDSSLFFTVITGLSDQLPYEFPILFIE